MGASFTASSRSRSASACRLELHQRGGARQVEINFLGRDFQGFGEVGNGQFVFIEPKAGGAAQREGFAILRANREHVVEILDGAAEIAQLSPAKAAAKKCVGVIRFETDALVVVVDGLVVALERDVDIATQPDGIGIIETQLDSGGVVRQGGIVLAQGEVGRARGR